jgi:hypothetical protein
MYQFATGELGLEQFREGLGKLTDAELLRFAQAAEYNSLARKQI